MTTAQANRPRRSALYMPASNAKAVEKARTLDADVIILDLEDAVAPEMKPAAREAAVAAVKAGGFGPREVVIRVNGLDTPWGADDLAAAAEAGPDAVLVPKVNDAADVRLYDQHLSAAPTSTRLWTMIETAKAAFHLWEIAEAAHSTRLSAWVMGVNDFAKEMRARQTPDRAPFLPLLTLSVAAARAHGLMILDGVHNDIEDLAALEAVCVQGVDFGFDGKTLIHPKHLEICNRVFSPSPEDVAWSHAVIAAFNAPENAGKGALRVDGKMAERLHLAQAERLVAVAQAISGRSAQG
ncbi:CoA ester lyase [Caulobacter vibrioides]|uniref:Citrate lyase beta subunit, putative n=2 Tax=Caulobacter vibrioides TaxID=155892 RepID=Q9A2A7_CAUVC|nr:CoA ester lyase [Caulobacter vibrioides]YP_002519147.1 citrate lyase beta chain/citryl-CoA lyase subunit [Caulobacter vibrioides NA1000]AAK25621.1 citrate lyase beta subunit, putative [Caulobacter vibrioides CB15]ACL97239.1 citrate lyase beta chain/citryl-CoA lyase subunit [Caulobacter vibrioides NA1000]ATC26553.1 CoA ester lyase [Caulobacter vibrioides]ATC30460.1 CoA ester lyase [Caulobacter vibrioides]AZH14638.1 CoA ester lyase [Caulobacter vibrioides]